MVDRARTVGAGVHCENVWSPLVLDALKLGTLQLKVESRQTKKRTLNFNSKMTPAAAFRALNTSMMDVNGVIIDHRRFETAKSRSIDSTILLSVDRDIDVSKRR